jgi:predicted ABC-type sugar transport system permease subunit
MESIGPVSPLRLRRRRGGKGLGSSDVIGVKPSRPFTVAIAAARTWLFLIFLLILFEVWSQIKYGHTFVASAFNLQAISVFTVAPLLVALGQTFVIISGGIDLSVGFTMGLASVAAAQLVNALGNSVDPAVAMLLGLVAALSISVVPGIVNGLLVARLRIPPFIGTLGMYGVARGASYLMAGEASVPVNNPVLTWIGNSRIIGVPVIVIITAVLVIIAQFVLTRTRFGQHTYAIGGNQEAALRAGINVTRHIVILYILSAVCAGVGGFLYAARFSAGSPIAGEPLLLDSIGAVVVGGASLFGGSGTVTGTLIGSLIIAVIQFGLVFIDVEAFWQFIAVGVVIIIAVLVDQSQRRIGGGR